VTITLPANTQVLYKFLNGSDFAGVETVPFECGVNDGFGGFNRTLNLNAADVVVPEVCFGSCVDCPISVDETNADLFSVYPNPARDQFMIQLGGNQANNLMIFDATGREVTNEKITTSGVLTIQTNTWESGLYKVVIPGLGSQNIIIE
jgi:Secretion system C-terminal sorting domain